MLVPRVRFGPAGANRPAECQSHVAVPAVASGGAQVVAWVPRPVGEPPVSVDGIARPTAPPALVRYGYAVLVVGAAFAATEALRSPVGTV